MTDVKGTILTAALATTPAAPGDTLTAYWTRQVPGAKDQIGLYRVGEDQAYEDLLAAPLLTGGSSSGNANRVLPDTLPPGLYLLILYGADLTNPTPQYVCQSQPFYVKGATTGYGNIHITGAGDSSHAGFVAGGRVFFDYDTATPTSGGDTVALAVVGGSVITTKTVSGGRGQDYFDLPNPLGANQYYELRYLSGANGELWSTSARFTTNFDMPRVTLGRIAWDSLRRGDRQDIPFVTSAPHASDTIFIRALGGGWTALVGPVSTASPPVGDAYAGTVYLTIPSTAAYTRYEACFVAGIAGQIAAVSTIQFDVIP